MRPFPHGHQQNNKIKREIIIHVPEWHDFSFYFIIGDRGSSPSRRARWPEQQQSVHIRTDTV